MKKTASQTEDKDALKAGDECIKDVDLTTFMADVIEASRTRLVIVDFHASWCGPCKQLGPALEKIVRAHCETVSLAKIDIDRNPEIAQQMRVQSIPAVFAFFQGQPVDGFMGALPESQIRAWLDKLLKALSAYLPRDSAADFDARLQQANELLQSGETTAAKSVFSGLLSARPESAGAFAGLLRCLIAEGRTEEAGKMLKNASPNLAKDKALDGVRAMLELNEQARNASVSLPELKAAVERNPGDHQARYDLSLALYAAGEREAAVNELLELVRRDRSWNEEAARKQLVKMFEAFGPADPLTVSARRRLASILFS